MIVAEEGFARTNGLPALARIGAMAIIGCALELMGIGSVAATRRALARRNGYSWKQRPCELAEAIGTDQLLQLAREENAPAGDPHDCKSDERLLSARGAGSDG